MLCCSVKSCRVMHRQSLLKETPLCFEAKWYCLCVYQWKTPVPVLACCILLQCFLQGVTSCFLRRPRLLSLLLYLIHIRKLFLEAKNKKPMSTQLTSYLTYYNWTKNLFSFSFLSSIVSPPTNNLEVTLLKICVTSCYKVIKRGD